MLSDIQMGSIENVYIFNWIRILPVASFQDEIVAFLFFSTPRSMISQYPVFIVQIPMIKNSFGERKN